MHAAEQLMAAVSQGVNARHSMKRYKAVKQHVIRGVNVYVALAVVMQLAAEHMGGLQQQSIHLCTVSCHLIPQ